MNKTFCLRGRGPRGHSALALAIATGLASLASVPATAAGLDTLQQQATKAAIASAFRAANPAVAMAPAQAPLPGDAFSRRWTAVTPSNPSDPDGWVDDEFEADWGLAAINAQYAYARGLSGAGVRLGLVDSGTAFHHSEFAGKDHRALVMADLLVDGTRCADTGVVWNASGTCFYSEGDKPAVTAEDFLLVDPADLAPDWQFLAGNVFYKFDSHGTHVAGTIAANRDGSGMHGVAFGADLSAVRMFNDALTLYDYDCLAGFDECLTVTTNPTGSALGYAYDQAIAQGVHVMNHSWGFGYEVYTPSDAVIRTEQILLHPGDAAYVGAIADASRRSGMVQVFSAGNTFDVIANPGVASPQPTAPATLPVVFPEIEQYWVSVVNLNDQLQLSNRSMKCGITAEWCIAAPGSEVLSTVVAEGTDVGDEWDSLAGDWLVDSDGNLRFELEDRIGVEGYAKYSGTSMAAPHVTGALGLLLERFPYLTAAQVRDVMLTTATDLGAPGVDEVYGWGLLNLRKAIEGYGQLRVDTEVVMNAAAGGIKTWEGGAWDDWTNDIGGPGRLTKSGAGWLRLSGDNSFGGATVTSGILEFDGDNHLTSNVRVEGGTLVVNGSFSGSPLEVFGGMAVVNGTVSGAPTYVGPDGTLGGSGTLGDTRVAGTIAPGNSIGTLTIDGDYVQEAGARFVAELLPPDQADLLRVTGTATLNGGTLVLSSEAGQPFVLGQQYQLLTAEGGIVGNFASVDNSNLSPFLSVSLLQGAGTFGVDVIRGAALATAAGTPNQSAIAASLDALPDSSSLLRATTQLSAAEARGAFDGLSGEIHASAQQVLLEGSRLVRDAALGRAGGNAFDVEAGRDTGAWVEIQHQGGEIAADGNAARARYSGNAVLVGIDHAFDAGWRIGVFGGTGDTDFNVRGRGSRGEASSTHVGVYAGTSWGSFGLSLGHARSQNEVEVNRTVAFRGYSDALASRYDADSSQTFVDVGYRFARGRLELEPYVQYAHVEVDTDGFSERGGAAALAGRGAEARADLSTVGLRLATHLAGSEQSDAWLSLRANLGYRHASGDQVRHARLGLVDGGEAFDVASPAIRDEALLLQIGAAARLSANSQLDLGLSHVDADVANDTGINARFTVNF